VGHRFLPAWSGSVPQARPVHSPISSLSSPSPGIQRHCCSTKPSGDNGGKRLERSDGQIVSICRWSSWPSPIVYVPLEERSRSNRTEPLEEVAPVSGKTKCFCFLGSQRGLWGRRCLWMPRQDGKGSKDGSPVMWFAQYWNDPERQACAVERQTLQLKGNRMHTSRPKGHDVYARSAMTGWRQSPTGRPKA
jgi:hypothetical protein